MATASEFSSSSAVNRKILVTGIPYITDDSGELKDKLTIHFGKRKNGGGDVETIICPFGASLAKALVVFESESVTDTVLKHTHQIGNTRVNVQRLPPVINEATGCIDDFYWNSLPRDKSEQLVLRLTKILGKDKVIGTKHKLTEVAGTIDQLKEVEKCMGETLGLLNVNSSVHMSEISERSVNVTGIPYLTDDKEQLNEEIQESITQKYGIQLEFVICPVKGDMGRAIVAFKSVDDRNRFLQHDDHTFFKQTLQVDEFPQVFREVEARVEDVYLENISREKRRKMANLMQRTFGSKFTKDGKTLTGSLKQVSDAILLVMDTFGLRQQEDQATSACDAKERQTYGRRVQEQGDDIESVIGSRPSGLKPRSYDLSQESTYKRDERSPIATPSTPSSIQGTARVTVAKYDQPTEFDDVNQATGDSVFSTPPEETTLLEPIEDYFGITSEAEHHSSGGGQMKVTMKPDDGSKNASGKASNSEIKSTQESSALQTRFSNCFVTVDKMTYQYMQSHHRKDIDSFEKKHHVKIKVSTCDSKNRNEQLVELKAKSSSEAKKGKQTTNIAEAQTEFLQMYSEIFSNTKKEVISFKNVDEKKLGKVHEKIKKKFPNLILIWNDDMECIICGEKPTVERASEELNDSISCYECMIVDKIAFEYLSTVNKDQLHEIKKKYNVDLEIQPVASKDTNGHAVYIRPNKSWKKKCKIEDLKIAKEEFISLYQKTFFSIKRIPVKCQGILEDVIKDASERTKRKYPNIIIIEANANELIFCAEESIAENVVREFRSLAGLLPKRRLKKSTANYSAEHGQCPDTTSDSIKPEHNPTNVHYVERRNSETLQSDFVTAEGLKISVITGDITKQKVDVIVNAANHKLSHDGGVAKAISTAAGPELQKECNDLLRGNYLQVGKCIDSNAFNLKCKRVVHAVGPTYQYRDEKVRFTSLLKQTFISVLLRTDTVLCQQSIAIPLISSGTNGGPKEYCAEALATALVDFSRDQIEMNLRQVLLVNKDEETTRILQQICSNFFSSISQSADPTKGTKKTINISRSQYKTSNGLEVIIENADITKVRADVIVNAANRDLRHGRGVAGAISKAAGKELQEECNRIMRTRQPLQTGECIVTDGYKLQCRVLHTVGPIYSKRSSDKEFFQNLMQTFLRVLQYANLPIEAKVVAVPLVSSGIYGGPKQMCARALLEAVEEFNKERTIVIKTIRLINLEEESTQALQNEFSKRYSGGATVAPMPKPGASKAVEAQGDLKHKTSRIKLYVKHGDITRQDVDAVVNPTDACLRNEFGVAKAIASTAGEKLQERCRFIMSERKHRTLHTGEIIETKGYGLKCKHILHTPSPYFTGGKSKTAQQKYEETLMEVFETCLFIANSKGAVSIAIPLIGAGNSGAPKEICANALAKAVIMFEKREEGLCLQEVVIISNDEKAVLAVEMALDRHFREHTSDRANDIGNRFRSDSLNHATMQDTEGHKADALNKGARPKKVDLNPQINPVSKEKQDYSEAESVEQPSFVSSLLSPVTNLIWKRTPSIDGAELDVVQSSPTKKQKSAAVSGQRHNTKASHSMDQIRCEKCTVGLDVKRLEGCNHSFCTHCITQYIVTNSKCLTCDTLYCVIPGKKIQGTMTYFIRNDLDLPGEPEKGAIVIIYSFPDGTLGETDAYAGRKYKGGSFKAYLPNTAEGLDIVWMLKTAFVNDLTFDVILTRSSLLAVTWSGSIPHKRNIAGGMGAYGYPDPNYLNNVRKELKKHGIVSSLTGGR